MKATRLSHQNGNLMIKARVLENAWSSTWDFIGFDGYEYADYLWNSRIYDVWQEYVESICMKGLEPNNQHL